jgi:hypothetical protein
VILTTAKHQQPVKMTFEDLESWRAEQKLSIKAACLLLGISWNKWDAMRVAGTVPRTVHLAWLAVYHRLDRRI